MNVKKLFDLTGRVAIVTGGSIGLGRQMAEGLAEMGANLVLTAEGFNVANRTNYASVNNEVGPVFGLPAALGGGGHASFNVHGIVPNFSTITPSTPLAFTSAFPKRQVQLGVRMTF